MARPAVSVVVPVHDAGPYIEPCIRSILRQSLPRDRFEVLFVDDGSADGTAERLDRLEREQPHVRVIHIQASGAPGRPRNVGLAAAIGEYVQFLDADDELAPRALERLHRLARASRSDIVLGKFASETLSRRQDLFSHPRSATTLAETPQVLDSSLGPTKLFAARLLRDREITFPEGWRQMEDQLFTLRAYAAAGVISILGDHPCYFFNRREDEGHISAELVDPDVHVEHLGELLDELARLLPDPALRARVTARLYRTEVLARLAGEGFLAAGPAYQQRLFDALHHLARDRFPVDAAAGAGAEARIRSALLVEGDLRRTVALAERTHSYGLTATATRTAWAGGRLVVEFEARLARSADGRPLTLVRGGETTLLDPAIADDLVAPVDVADELATIRAQVAVVEPQTSLEWILPGGAGLTLRPDPHAGPSVVQPILSGVLELDPDRVGPGARPLEAGSWTIVVRWAGLGFQALDTLRIPESAAARGGRPIELGLIGRRARWVVARTGSGGLLQVAIAGPGRVPAGMDPGGVRAVRDGSALEIALPVATGAVGRIAAGTLRLSGPRRYDLEAEFRGVAGRVTIASGLPADGTRLDRGRYAISAHLGGGAAPGLDLGHVLVRDDGRFVLLGMRRLSLAARALAWLRWSVDTASGAARSRALAVVRRLPPPVKDAVRAAYARRRP